MNPWLLDVELSQSSGDLSWVVVAVTDHLAMAPFIGEVGVAIDHYTYLKMITVPIESLKGK